MCVWQSEEQRCAAVLREVFVWLDGRSLARAGAACCAWRRAAAEPGLWRHLLQRELLVAPHTLQALAFHYGPSAVQWRQEYVSARAGWRLAARHRMDDTLLHGALSGGGAGARLALGAADASASVWRRRGGAWAQCGRTDMRGRGWAAVARVQWAGAGTRLLLGGPLALVDEWELVVLRVEEDGRCGAIESRVRCSAGAAGCWVDEIGGAFLSFELHRYGPGLFCTTVRLNAATQETQSEFVGVTTPLLRIYNEDGANISHALTADAPPCDTAASAKPGQQYLRALEPPAPPPSPAARLLVAGGGCRLGVWPLAAPSLPPLLASAAGELAERVRRRRRRLAEAEAAEGAEAAAEGAGESYEAMVRAACTAPVASCRLHAPIIGLVLHERGACMWAVSSDGSATCVSVAALTVLSRVCEPAPAPAASPYAHFVQPAASAALLAWPAGALSSRVRWCAARSCAAGAELAHAAPAVCCVLAPRELLVLAGEQLYVWCSRATPQQEA